MSKLSIDLATCVRVSSKYSECSKCHDICPLNESAIIYDENIPKILDHCIDCGGCVGICPSSAISLSDFDGIDFIFNLLKSEKKEISCKLNAPCLAYFSIEELLSLAVLSEGEVVLDIGHCKECEVASLYQDAIVPNIDEANRLLSDLGSSFSIKAKDLSLSKEDKKSDNTPSRREFLKRFSTKGAIRSKIELDRELEKIDKLSYIDSTTTSKIRQKSFPDKRKLFYMALKRLKDSGDYKMLDQDSLSFISTKSIDQSCDNCSFCYRLCPTGALSSDQRGSKIEFDALACIKCHLCHDVCQTNSIHIEDFNTKEFFHSKVEKLIEFKQIRCEECGNFFTLFDDSTLCPRCKIEEEEAKSLWGIQ